MQLIYISSLGAVIPVPDLGNNRDLRGNPNKCLPFVPYIPVDLNYIAGQEPG